MHDVDWLYYITFRINVTTYLKICDVPFFTLRESDLTVVWFSKNLGFSHPQEQIVYLNY